MAERNRNKTTSEKISAWLSQPLQNKTRQLLEMKADIAMNTGLWSVLYSWDRFPGTIWPVPVIPKLCSAEPLRPCSFHW